MEHSKIPMFDRFDTTSHIMPYYSQTDSAFLLLSSLCTTSRSKLDEYYNEFISLMKENWKCISKFYYSKDRPLPTDLFLMFIEIRAISLFDSFVQFIKSYTEVKGCYFNNHYMHLQIKIRDKIRVHYAYIEKIYPYLDNLKSIQVRVNRNLNELISLDTIAPVF